jgi:hypothetical protein
MTNIIGSIPVTGLIAPTSSGDTYAVTDAIYARDGLRNVETLLDRDNISLDRRRQGMVVGTEEGQKYWRLKPNSLSAWSLGNADNWELLFDLSNNNSIILTAFNGVENRLGKFGTNGTTLINSSISDNGTIVNIDVDVVIPSAKTISSTTEGPKISLGFNNLESFGVYFDNTVSNSYLSLSQDSFSGHSNSINLSTASSVLKLNNEKFRLGINGEDSFIISMCDVSDVSSETTNLIATIINSTNSTVIQGVSNSVVMGGNQITANTSNTVYVPSLNIKDAQNSTSNKLLVLSTDGTVEVNENFSTVINTKYFITEGETVNVGDNEIYIVYGNLTVNGTLNISASGKVVVINGNLIIGSNGSVNNAGTILLEQVQSTGLLPIGVPTKYSATFSSTIGVSTTIHHGLNTLDFVASAREGMDIIEIDINIIDLNTIEVQTTVNVTNGKINIIGL